MCRATARIQRWAGSRRKAISFLHFSLLTRKGSYIFTGDMISVRIRCLDMCWQIYLKGKKNLVNLISGGLWYILYFNDQYFGFKNPAFLCCLSCKYLDLQYLSIKARKDQIFCSSYSSSWRKYRLKGRGFSFMLRGDLSNSMYPSHISEHKASGILLN